MTGNRHRFAGMPWRVILMAGMFALLFHPGQTAIAQDGGRVVISVPETGQFPTIGVYMEVFDSQGNFIEDLQPTQVQVVENDRPLPLVELTLHEPGIQVTVALNLAPMMGYAVGGGTYYQQFQQALINWAQTQPAASPDDFSLATNTGLQAIRLADPQQWLQALTGFQPDLSNSAPGTDSLNSAIQMANDPNPRPQMRRVIVYITPPPDSVTQRALPNMADMAAQLGVRIIVWLVAPETQVNSSEVEALRQVANRTGGQFYALTGNNPLPDLQATLRPLRMVYHLTYNSALSKSGDNRLAVRVERTGVQAVSQVQTFKMTILPPNPMFISPPTRVERAPAKDNEGKLEPDEFPIQMLVEFPDGYKRPLQISRLYVNGKVVAEKNQPPFDEFELPLESYASNDHLLLKVEVMDTLGLTSSSIEAPVDITVRSVQSNLLSQLLVPQNIIIGGGLLVTVLVLGGVLVYTGRRTIPGWRKTGQKQTKDPVTQPVSTLKDTLNLRRKEVEASATRPRPASPISAPARMIYLSEDGNPLPGSAISLSLQETIFGSDPRQASVRLDAPSVDALHARLICAEDGTFTLADAGSVAGTWVNFAPISPAGARLQHGDVIHIGRVSFRFELTNPPQMRMPKVSSPEEEKP